MTKERVKKPKPDAPPAAHAAYEAYRRKLDTPLDELDPPQRKSFMPKRSQELEDLIVATLEKGYTRGFACDKAGIHIRTLDEWRQQDADGKPERNAEFNARCKAAVERGTDMLEDEATRRARDGVDEPVFQQGECVGFKRVYSDTLMQTMLGGRRPSKFGKQRHEHSGPGGEPIPHTIQVAFVKPSTPPAGRRQQGDDK